MIIVFYYHENLKLINKILVIMKLMKPLMLLLLMACATATMAQTNQEVNLCVNLSEILDMNENMIAVCDAIRSWNS